MTKKTFSLVISIVIALTFNYKAHATIIINSLQTVGSTCTNNGSINVLATTSTGTLLYAITAGPVTFPVQTSSLFSSLPPGDYTIEVTNTNNEKKVGTVTVIGNYTLPDFFPLATHPDCPNASTGIIDGNPTAATGLSPFTWELITPSTVTRPVQSNPVFNGLPQGTYTLRMTDACNNIQTKTVILFTPPNTMMKIADRIQITGCDTATIMPVLIVSEDRPPYKLTYDAAGVSYSFDTAKLLDVNGSVQPIITAPNVTYGSAITNITITNACGTQIYIPRIDVCPFNFWTYNTPIPGEHCEAALLTTFPVGVQGVCDIGPKLPLTIDIRDAVTNSLIETKTYNNPLDGNYTTTAMEPGKTYNVTMTDSCKNTVTNVITSPVTKKYVNISSNAQQALLDSTVIYYIYAHGFPTTGTKLIILDGPPSLQSTKHGYSYYEEYVYPKTFDSPQLNSDSSIVFPMWNVGPGKYHYNIIDSCGNVYVDSFEVTKNDVASFYSKYNYIKGCSGESGIQYEFKDNSFCTFTITDLNTNTIVFQTNAHNGGIFSGVLNNVTASDYEMTIGYYGSNGGFIDINMNNIYIDQYISRDTIHILPYRNPSLQSSSSVLCNGNLSLILTADSSRGIPPYQYEILSGPQTFSPQASNVFELTQKGVYKIRLTDKCGNSTSTDVTVDNLIFPPLSKIGSSCINGNVELTYGASQYFSYTWTTPNGTIYNGDTLIITPVTIADTGLYAISRLTTINGCTSTQSTTYRLTAGTLDSFSVAICTGQTYIFDSKTITQPGIYRDTITTSLCDSIVILNLSIADYKKDSTAKTICKNQSYTFGSKVLTQTGIYRDTIKTSSCDSISIINLTVNDYTKDSTAKTICKNQPYTFGSKVLTQTGIYRDTIKTSSCDSISIINLTVNDYTKDSTAKTICKNQSYTFGSKVLTQTGIYRDTIKTSSCDSISIINLTVNDYKKDSAAKTICKSQPYTFGSKVLTQTGIYRDTIKTSSCDSISIINLTVNDYTKDSTAKTICKSQSYTFGSKVLTQTGIYRDTIKTSSCDSISIINLTVNDYTKDSTAKTICKSQPYTFGSRVLTQTGIYRDTIKTSSCDSISIINLTVNDYTKDSTAKTICKSQSYTFGSKVLTQTGIYRDTIKTSSCDSISIINLTVNDYTKDSTAKTICKSQPYTFGSRVLTQTGIYRDTIKTSSCDSISIINLTVNDYKKDSTAKTICKSQPYSFGSRILTQTGIYRDTIKTSSCDSISIINLTVNDYKKDSSTAFICQGQSYQFGNSMLTQQGIYRDTFPTATCDSISILNLKVYNTSVIDATSDKYIVTKGELIQLDAVPSNLSSYTWSSNNSLSSAVIHNPSSIVNSASWYKVIAVDGNNCTTSDSVFIEIVNDTIVYNCSNTSIYVPNAFTPNMDGNNDVFRVLGGNVIGYKEYYLMVYNRWGSKVFETNNPLVYWDGMYRGKPAEAGNYVFYLRFICQDGSVSVRKGNVILLR